LLDILLNKKILFSNKIIKSNKNKFLRKSAVSKMLYKNVNNKIRISTNLGAINYYIQL